MVTIEWHCLYILILSQKKIPSYLHDLLSIESPEAKAIGDVDGVYSYLSRMSSEMGGVVEWLWGNVTNSGNESSLVSINLTCKTIQSFDGRSP